MPARPDPVVLRRRALRRIVAGVVAASVPPAAVGEPGPLRLVVPFPPGSSTDGFARTVAEKLGAVLGVEVIVENRPGAGGNTGAEVVARAAPDGNTLLVSTSAAILTTPTSGAAHFDPRAALAPVAELNTGEFALAASARRPWSSAADVVDAARMRPASISYAAVGPGAQAHLAGVLFARRAGIALVHRPMPGAAQALTALLDGSVDLVLAPPALLAPQVRAERLRILATTGSARSIVFPDAPRLADTLPGLAIDSWTAVFAPRATPPEIIDRLAAALVEVLGVPDLNAGWAQQGYQVSGLGPRMLAEKIEREARLWEPLVRAAGTGP